MNTDDWWRLLNSLLALGAFIALTIYVKGYYKQMSRRRLFISLSLGGLLLTTAYGSLESIYLHVPIGLRTALTTASCLWCIYGLWVSRNDKFK